MVHRGYPRAWVLKALRIWIKKTDILKTLPPSLDHEVRLIVDHHPHIHIPSLQVHAEIRTNAHSEDYTRVRVAIRQMPNTYRWIKKLERQVFNPPPSPRPSQDIISLLDGGLSPVPSSFGLDSPCSTCPSGHDSPQSPRLPNPTSLLLPGQIIANMILNRHKRKRPTPGAEIFSKYRKFS